MNDFHENRKELQMDVVQHPRRLVRPIIIILASNQGKLPDQTNPLPTIRQKKTDRISIKNIICNINRLNFNMQCSLTKLNV